MKYKPFIKLLIGVGIFGAFYYAMGSYLSIARMQEYSHQLSLFVARNYMCTATIFTIVMTGMVACGLPIVIPATLMSGFLFGAWWGGIFAVISSFAGSLIAFLFFRYVLGAMVKKRYHDRLEKFNERMHAYGPTYILLLHYSAVVPLFIINSCAALTKLSFLMFALMTFLGLIPVCFIYAFAGRQLSTIQSVSDIFSPIVIVALASLAFLALLPIIIKRIKSIGIPAQHINKAMVALVIVVGIVAVWASGVYQYMTLEQLQIHGAYLQDLVSQHYVRAVVLFMMLYILITVLFLPITILCTLAAGFLFGSIPGALYTTVALTIGGTFAFMLVRYVIGDRVQKKFSTQLHAMNYALEQYGRYYLLTLHILPLPTHIITPLFGLTAIRVGTFMWTLALGTLPGTLIYTFVGQELHAIHSLDDVVSTPMLIALCLLALLAIVPVIIRWIIKKR
jgi:uncharacterized membrane protein YdjX (TVP38/TMEM64 family)